MEFKLCLVHDSTQTMYYTIVLITIRTKQSNIKFLHVIDFVYQNYCLFYRQFLTIIYNGDIKNGDTKYSIFII